MPKKEIIDMLNRALEMEHQAFVQYLSHAELVEGLNSEPIIARLKEIANDEKGHQEKIRELVGSYLGGVPSMGIAKTESAKTIEQILKANLKGEIEAVDFYAKVMEKVKEDKKDLPYMFLKLEHEVRHIIMDEQEHIMELKTLLGMR